MTEPTKAQTIDTELPRHCAFTLPGVILALGKDNWHCVKDTFEMLASDMQVMIRQYYFLITLYGHCCDTFNLQLKGSS